MSTINEITEQKMKCVTRSKADIIFLCDTRLNSTVQIAGVNNLIKKFKFQGYDFFHNSKGPNRGTGILISSKLQTEIIATDSDEDGNFIVQKVKINDHILVIGSVYGPNINENIGVFDNLTAAVKNLNTTDIILGGDWNCTWDCRNVDVNVDVLDMVSIPSKRRSEKLKQMCNGLGLTDPFRVLYPNKKDYSYVPAVLQYTNRSRLDFFCNSKKLTNIIKNSTIENSLNSTVFDHKAINLDFKCKIKPRKNMQVRNFNLKNNLIVTAISNAAVECYLQHAAIN